MIEGTYLTPAEYAARLSVTPATVVAWIAAGELRALNLSRRGKRPRWRIRPDDAEAFERGRATSTTSTESTTRLQRRDRGHRPPLKYCKLR